MATWDPDPTWKDMWNNAHSIVSLLETLFWYKKALPDQREEQKPLVEEKIREKTTKLQERIEHLAETCKEMVS